jgi:hypothetical protein
MEQSTTISKLAQALCRFQQKCQTIEFDSTVKVAAAGGQEYSFKYASYPRIVTTIRPLLTDCKLSFSQLAEPHGSVTTLLIHESGEYLKSTLLIPSVHKSPQQIGSAISYARRYGLSAILGLATDEDDDGNSASGNSIEHKAPVTKTTKQAPSADMRPWITAQQLEQVIERIEAGELEVMDKTIKTYRIRRSYRAQLDKVYESVKKNGIVVR